MWHRPVALPMPNPHYYQGDGWRECHSKFCSTPHPSSLYRVIGGRNIIIFCPSSRVVFIVLAWQWAAQFFLVCQNPWIYYSVPVISWSWRQVMPLFIKQPKSSLFSSVWLPERRLHRLSLKSASISGSHFISLSCTRFVSVRGSRWLKPESRKLRQNQCLLWLVHLPVGTRRAKFWGMLWLWKIPSYFLHIYIYICTCWFESNKLMQCFSCSWSLLSVAPVACPSPLTVHSLKFHLRGSTFHESILH